MKNFSSFPTQIKALVILAFVVFAQFSFIAQSDTLHLYYHYTSTKLADTTSAKIDQWIKKLNGKHVDVIVAGYYNKPEFKKFATERTDELFLILNRKARALITIEYIGPKKGEHYQRTSVDIIYKPTVTAAEVAEIAAKAQAEETRKKEAALAEKAAKDEEKRIADETKKASAAAEKAVKDEEKRVAAEKKKEADLAEKAIKDEEKRVAEEKKKEADASEKAKKDEEKKVEEGKKQEAAASGEAEKNEKKAEKPKKEKKVKEKETSAEETKEEVKKEEPAKKEEKKKKSKKEEENKDKKETGSSEEPK